ncbi:DUF2334 domain-containing protein [Cohnella endophytica]|uniref:DUF2334 domain-containing protein n=1 Tax=Cohnella endophytica TaxID=2419778 RepID=A0A494Y435_9BACL|nr:DUF2334 domain-containing protein [Cohnella endophytica]RKP55036.1 DUF2334 domain-containing protein [Cohnella endophytica]
MKRKWWIWTGILVGFFLVATAALTYYLTYTGTNIYPDLHKRHAMIRLEDVGPGGDYGSPEGLGMLRAVMEELETRRIPFHVAVIPRRMNLNPAGEWQERGIDDPNPDLLVKSFIRLLQEAQLRGGVLGMHGYSHQYGEYAMKSGNQNSGAGLEFKVPGVPETKETAYAAARIASSLAAFEKADLHPGFWESPHYKDTREQEKVFRSYIGMLFEPDLFSLRSLKDLNAYDNVNAYGQRSLGSVYVPTPLGYVGDGKSVDRMLSKAASSDGLASFYFHPFLEFPFLEQVLGPDGKPAMKDDLPVYRYKDDASASFLHRLTDGFGQLGYRWMSLYDIVPFTPAHRVALPPSSDRQQVLLGDVFGRGHDDVVVREAHRISVVPGTYEWPRNRAQQAPMIWLKESFAPEEQLLLGDLNGDGKQDLIAYNRQTGDVRACWAEEDRFAVPVSLGRLPSGLASLQSFHSDEARGLIASRKGRILLIRYANSRLDFLESKATLPADCVLYAGKFQTSDHDDILCVSSANDKGLLILNYENESKFANPRPIDGIRLTAGEQLLVGDPNGDGRSDLIAYSAKTGVWRVYENEGHDLFRKLDNDFGPWAHGKGKIGFAADFDGNGKTDIGSYDESGRLLDIALSFRSRGFRFMRCNNTLTKNHSTR